MKTNFYILLVLLLTVSFAGAQSEVEVVNSKAINTVTVSSNVEENTVKANDSLLIDAAEVKETIARSSSDIRIYLNLKRKEGNIDLLFPKINKAVKA